jgi:hypothetical protein
MTGIEQLLASLGIPGYGNGGLGRLITDEGPTWEPLPEEHDLDLEEEYRKMMEKEKRSGTNLHRNIFDFLDWD